MSAEQPSAVSKIVGTAVLAASMFSLPAFAVEGAGAKFSFFGGGASSPFTIDEKREDPIYSPYSPYGNGQAAAYNERKGSSSELASWKEKLDVSIKRTKNIPALTKAKKWQDVRTEMTSYSYNMREALLRVAEASKNPEKAKAAAKKYFVDLNDMFVLSEQKNGGTLLEVYDLSVKDLDNFLALVK
eukprot:CAMPEP_0182416130 /NCGR_PEP_ID=MMETSP1167-20130531/265_1 /TAXON_ID=2988 /ORGANISM="Mallomonas Sp, Strain CCMP3275" /LENGTH=185 /DNA_ID=CAMNT_0024588589 /DNA_START=159 /DNA_END=716 /DNA_ORIENTATION=-